MVTKRDVAWLLQEKYHGVKSPDFEADLLRLNAGEPLAYVIGYVPFLNAQIWLDSRPLIPRPETEYWVNEALQTISPPRRVLDLCAGSGAIGVATLLAFPDCTVDFIELDNTHLPTIEKNLRSQGISLNRYHLYPGDLFEALQQNQRYDVIFSNPPYIDESLGRTDQSVLEHEPPEALFSENSGLAHITRIIQGAVTVLQNPGELWIEHEPEHTARIHELGKKYSAVHTHCDQYGVERFSRLVLL